MEASLTRLLAPVPRINVMERVAAAQKQGRPYTIVFVGVNGVGKSTNLAKVSHWLLKQRKRVCIAGCDTFRAGAVEQLRTHAMYLSKLHPTEEGSAARVTLYERGYGKTAAKIAYEAIKWATTEQFDVVLVDTAGRMQDNRPLMEALAKLVDLNKPDLILFVGEALVGNEAVDQLEKFNQAMTGLSKCASPHLIDGILLTKYDTIDDKVGAAISMTQVKGQQIVFVGTGQTYEDLEQLSIKSVVRTLLSPGS